MPTSQPPTLSTAVSSGLLGEQPRQKPPRSGIGVWPLGVGGEFFAALPRMWSSQPREVCPQPQGQWHGPNLTHTH